ncbi:50S ribosomal protein L15 [Ureaplasma miroungigenitalium]|uniref:Large ribosomal subunit protein uL15 n=1 Tax=Ureaplasma miroungigenitalium TaxID=1042321 RepID=A0ABT3BME2_9BACT|nr:50S ribosomal protein L15 [Ureaplasma miroungigenitalium]MCV3728396.1 50S ribosomal protein L15 [Ureaplasma miroungigenitalium]MCV3734183.1 50S ribosomal protein L15 [Ureaplasma miroungigenitalium]
MELSNLQYTPKSRNHKEKRVGRGHGSGLGKTSGRGQDGQKARKSGQVRLAFEGGQTPLYRRTPKVGFSNYNFKKQFNVISLHQLSLITDALKAKKGLSEDFVYDLAFFNDHGLIKNAQWPIKIIGNNDVIQNTKVYAHVFSKGARASIEKNQSEAITLDK